MALDAGVLSVTLQFGQNLKDQDWFGKQDPYAILKCGGQTVRSRTHIDGGRNPVWNQTFSFNIINENSIEIKLFDEDTLTRDDVIGEAVVSLARVREFGTDTIQAPVVSPRSRKQHGFVQLQLKYESNRALKPQPMPYPPQPSYGAYPPYPAAYPQPPAPAPYPYGAPPAYPAGYPMYPTAPAPAPYPGAPPAPYAAPPPYPGAYPPQPQPYAYPPQPQPYPGAYPAPYPGAPPPAPYAQPAPVKQ